MILSFNCKEMKMLKEKFFGIQSKKMKLNLKLTSS
jgi:hypothetical protein